MPGISGQLKIGFMYLAFKICICYNAGRQKDKMYLCDTRESPGGAISWAFFLFSVVRILQAGYRSFIAVQPFDDVVAGYTSRNGNNKG